jgi:hypothetical protein
MTKYFDQTDHVPSTKTRKSRRKAIATGQKFLRCGSGNMASVVVGERGGLRGQKISQKCFMPWMLFL